MKERGIVLLFICAVLLVIQSTRHIVHQCPIPAPDSPVQTITTPDRLITFEDLLDAIEMVESGGDENAIGAGGEAVGSFQIHKIYVDDVNRIQLAKHEKRHMGYLPYRYEWRKDRNISRDIVSIYLRYYATMRRIGRKPTVQDKARIHNGGPNGWKKESTIPYWEKVKKLLK